MGANQSTVRQGDEAGSSRCLAFCTSRDDVDGMVEAPERHLRISKGQLQPGRAGRSPLQSPLRTPEPVTRGQPVQRSKMSALSVSTIDTTRDTPDPNAKGLHSVSDRYGPVADRKQDMVLDMNDDDMQRRCPPEPGLDEVLPKSRRLSPMPDFTIIHAEEMAHIAAAEPWVKVRNIAEKTPSRRSSFLDHPRSPRLGAARSASSRSLTSVRSGAGSAAGHHGVRSKSSTAERKTGDASHAVPSIPYPQAPSPSNQRSHNSPALRLHTDLDADRKAKSDMIQNDVVLFAADTTRSGTPTRSSSPKRNLSKRLRIRKDIAGSPERNPGVEDAVRELEQIVQSKRGIEDTETPASGTTQNPNSNNKAHRPAIAPKMLMQDVSSTLLDEIGSGLSRPLSEGSMSSPLKMEQSNSTTSSLPLSTISKRRSTRRESSWPGPLGADADAPRHSGTFFFSRQSLDEIMSPKSAGKVVTPITRTRQQGDSPVDKRWSHGRGRKSSGPRHAATNSAKMDTRAGGTKTQKPLPAKPATTAASLPNDDEPHSPTLGPTFVPFHHPNYSNASQATTMTAFSVSSNLFPSVPTTPAANIPALPMSKKFPLPPRHIPQQRSEERTASPSRPERPPSRTDASSAVLAARKRAASRVAEQEAAGMGLGIGGMLSAADVANIVEMDVWNAKPAHQHPSRSRTGSAATHRTDSILVEPSMSPNVVTDGTDAVGGFEAAMSVQVPKVHVAQLVRTSSGKNVPKAPKKMSEDLSKDDTDPDRPRPLAGAPRHISRESNTLPGTTAPAQNEARIRKHRSKSIPRPAQHPPLPTSTPALNHVVAQAQGHDPTRNRSASAAAHTHGAKFGLELQRSASARRLREVEAELARIEKEQQHMGFPAVPKGSTGGLKPAEKRDVRASQVGMAF